MSTPARVGVFGGTFDPVHVGHLIVASVLRHALALDRLLFVPAGRPPHKAPAEVTPDAVRLELLRLALADEPRFEISRIELNRPGPSYTVETLATLAAALDPVSLVFLMGEDSLRDLPNWRQPGRIAVLAELAVAVRPGVDVDVAEVLAAVPEARGRTRLIPVPLIGVSSHDIRRRVASGEPISYQVPRPVERYILDHGLYRP